MKQERVHAGSPGQMAAFTNLRRDLCSHQTAHQHTTWVLLGQASNACGDPQQLICTSVMVRVDMWVVDLGACSEHSRFRRHIHISAL